jgi:lysophospholipase L1-like esterase
VLELDNTVISVLPRSLRSLILLVVFAGFLLAASSGRASTPVPRVVFFGDTVTYYWGTWLNGNPKWLNRGSSGPPFQNQAYQMLARFQSTVVSLHPDMVHILVGTADVAVANDATFATTVQSVQTSIMGMVAQAREANIEVILGTIPPQLVNNSGATVPVFQPLLTLQINAWIESYGLANHIPVVNYHDALCLCVGSTSPNESSTLMMSPSGTVPSSAGYDVMTALAQAAVATYDLPLNGGHLGNVATLYPQGNRETNATTISLGSSVQFMAYGMFGHSIPGTMLNTNFAGLNGTWTSSNPAVLNIGYNGEAFAASPGTATITYTAPQGIRFAPWVMTVEGVE